MGAVDELRAHRREVDGAAALRAANRILSGVADPRDAARVAQALLATRRTLGVVVEGLGDVACAGAGPEAEAFQPGSEGALDEAVARLAHFREAALTRLGAMEAELARLRNRSIASRGGALPGVQGVSVAIRYGEPEGWKAFRRWAVDTAHINRIGQEGPLRLAYLALGLAGEAEEATEAAWTGASPWAVREELADFAWYLAMLDELHGGLPWPVAPSALPSLESAACRLAEAVKRPAAGREISWPRFSRAWSEATGAFLRDAAAYGGPEAVFTEGLAKARRRPDPSLPAAPRPADIHPHVL